MSFYLKFGVFIRVGEKKKINYLKVVSPVPWKKEGRKEGKKVIKNDTDNYIKVI